MQENVSCSNRFIAQPVAVTFGKEQKLFRILLKKQILRPELKPCQVVFRSITRTKEDQNVQEGPERSACPHEPLRVRVLVSIYSHSQNYTGRKWDTARHVVINILLQEEELQQITGSTSTCKTLKLLPTAVPTNSSGRTVQTLTSHRGHSSLYINKTVVRLICLLSCMVSAILCLNKSIIQMNTSFNNYLLGNSDL